MSYGQYYPARYLMDMGSSSETIPNYKRDPMSTAKGLFLRLMLTVAHISVEATRDYMTIW